MNILELSFILYVLNLSAGTGFPGFVALQLVKLQIIVADRDQSEYSITIFKVIIKSEGDYGSPWRTSRFILKRGEEIIVYCTYSENFRQ